jgi:uncharacterized phage-associated protein
VNAIVYFSKYTKRCHKLKLFKLLHFFDFEHYRQTGKASIGLAYEAWPKGPVPPALDREIEALGADLRTAVRITVRRDRYSGKPLRFEFAPKVAFDPKYFSKRELRIMRELALYFNEFDADDMSELSHHRGLPWQVVYRNGAGNRHPIPYELALKSDRLTDGDTITADELEYRREALDGLPEMI